MDSLQLRLLILGLYATTIPVSGEDGGVGGGSCGAAHKGPLDYCTDKVHVELRVSSLNGSVSAVPVQSRLQPSVKVPVSPAAPRRPAVSARSKFLVERTHFKVQLDAMRRLREQFSTAPPHFDRDIEYYDQVLGEYDDYVAEKEKNFDYCKEDGRLGSSNEYLIPADPGRRANDYEVFPGLGVFRFHTRPLRWEEARRQCEAEDAQLLVVNSEEEANATMSMFSRCRHLTDQQLNDYAFVGVRQTRVGGDYLTLDGESVDVAGYASWDFGHPDSSPTKNVKCVSINRQGFLVDLDCHLRLAYFCEYQGI